MAKQIEFVNPNNHTVHLTNPDKSQISIGPKQKVVLSEWYKRYSPKYLRVVGSAPNTAISHTRTKPKAVFKARQVKNFGGVTSARKVNRAADNNKPKRQIIQRKVSGRGEGVRAVSTRSSLRSRDKARRGRIVGRVAGGNSAQMYKNISANLLVPISNNIGIGILSYNRPESLRRLLDSIMRTSDMAKTTVFVSDESTDKKGAIREVIKHYGNAVTFIDNSNRLGVSGNTNRLLRCLDRFKYKILMNDDVEVLKEGWDEFYFQAMRDTGMHHFCFREPGIYGAKEGVEQQAGNRTILTVQEKPHGAIMAFDDVAFKKVGYFDERFGLYGMEHVDWSNRVSLSKIQAPGFHDVKGSLDYFQMVDMNSATENRSEHLRESRRIYDSVKNEKSRIRVEPSEKSKLPAMSVIIPYRQADRSGSVMTVINNMRAMRFPVLEIIVSEQDDTPKLNLEAAGPIRYIWNENRPGNTGFCKAQAFNNAVMRASYERLVLQDADIIIQASYMNDVYRYLSSHGSCHLGDKVFYINKGSTEQLNNTKTFKSDYNCENVVGYFEGGSLACKKSAYVDIGGFNDSYVGYGVEDCDFYERLYFLTSFKEERTYNFFHLWHGRTDGWDRFHDMNKRLEEEFRRKYSDVRKYADFLRSRLIARYGQS